MKKLFCIVLLLAIGVGVGIRSTELFSGNYLFGFDQGRDFLAVKSIVVDHKFTLIGSEIGAGAAGFKGIFHGPFYYYSLVIPFIIFWGNPYGGMVLMFIFGVTSLFFSYFLGKTIFNKMTGLVIASLVSLSNPLVSQSRFIWNSHPSTIFILLTFYFTFLIPKRKPSHAFLAAFFSAFIYNFELAMAIPVSLTLLIYFVFILRIKSLKQYAHFFLGFCLGFAPALFFELRHNFLAIRGIVLYLFHHEETQITRIFISYLLRDHYKAFSYNFASTFPPQQIFPPLILFLVTLIPSIYLLTKEKNAILKKFIIFLFLVPLINFFVFSFLRNAVYDYYLIDISLVYILLWGYIWYASYSKSFRLHVAFSCFLVILIFLAIPYYVKNFYDDYRDYGGTAKIKGKTDAVDYIYKDNQKKDFGLFVFSPPIYTYPYDYLLWWYGKNKYGFIPEQKKESTFYVLIEEDTGKRWSYKGWLETVIKTGKVVYTKKLPSGFIIQKRVNEI